MRLFNLALGSAVGQVPFVIGHSDAAGHISTGSQERASFDVACDTIDHLVSEGATPGPNLIKIDVEGHESRVLAGSETVLRKFRPLLAVELHTPDQDREVGRFLKRVGYCTFRQNSLIEVRNMESGWPDPDGMQGAILAIPKEKVADYSWLIKLNRN